MKKLWLFVVISVIVMGVCTPVETEVDLVGEWYWIDTKLNFVESVTFTSDSIKLEYYDAMFGLETRFYNSYTAYSDTIAIRDYFYDANKVKSAGMLLTYDFKIVNDTLYINTHYKSPYGDGLLFPDTLIRGDKSQWINILTVWNWTC